MEPSYQYLLKSSQEILVYKQGESLWVPLGLLGMKEINLVERRGEEGNSDWCFQYLIKCSPSSLASLH